LIAERGAAGELDAHDAPGDDEVDRNALDRPYPELADFCAVPLPGGSAHPSPQGGRHQHGSLPRAPYASPAIDVRLEEAGYFYAIRVPANAVLREKIAHRLTRPVGRPSLTKVKRFFEEFHWLISR